MKKSRCDIVIPVYNAFNCLKNCIDSVLRYTDFSYCKLIVIDDKSPDERVLQLLEKYEKDNKGKIVLLRNKTNLGFVKTVNKGMKYSRNDVLLLNSDTIVSDGWLDAIIECGGKDERIATVTPFSNNLTPIKPLSDNFRREGFPPSYDLEKMANLVRKCSLKMYPELPSAHGFCMYIKRGVLDKVGYFDEKSFGKGYGEENDFCFRCFKYGYKHVLCDDAYVYHEGTQSFLDKKELHNDELVRKHPKIMVEVGKWYQAQEIDLITDNVELAIGMNEKKANILVMAKGELASDVRVTINKLRKNNNIHVLEKREDNYRLHSYFEMIDLDTAIYRRPIVVGGSDEDSISFGRMIREIEEIFGISIKMSVDKILDKNTVDVVLKEIEPKKGNYEWARAKMLEVDLVNHVKKAKENVLSQGRGKEIWLRRRYDNPKSKIGKILRLPRTVWRIISDAKVRHEFCKRFK